MKKSLFALLLALLSTFSATLVYADEMATDDSMATVEPSADEPLPPLMDEGAK